MQNNIPCLNSSKIGKVTERLGVIDTYPVRKHKYTYILIHFVLLGLCGGTIAVD